jgi:hypothetical protein
MLQQQQQQQQTHSLPSDSRKRPAAGIEATSGKQRDQKRSRRDIHEADAAGVQAQQAPDNASTALKRSGSSSLGGAGSPATNAGGRQRHKQDSPAAAAAAGKCYTKDDGCMDWQPAAAHDMLETGLLGRINSSSSTLHERQQQEPPERQQQQQVPRTYGDRRALAEQLSAIARAHKGHISGCKFWSGTAGSCRNRSCKHAASHVLGQPTAHYEARAAAFRAAGAVCDATGNYTSASVGQAAADVSRHQQQQQQQQQQWGSPSELGPQQLLVRQQREQLRGHHHDQLQQQQQQQQRRPDDNHGSRQPRDCSRSPVGRQQQQQQRTHVEQEQWNQQEWDKLDRLQQMELERQLQQIMGRLTSDLREVEKHWRLRPDHGCKFWSGVRGSCGNGNKCREGRSHLHGQPTRELE